MRLTRLLIFASVSVAAALVIPASAEIQYGSGGGSIYDAGEAARARAAQEIEIINRGAQAQSEAMNRIGSALTGAIQRYGQQREELAREQRQKEVANVELADVSVRGYTRKDGTYVPPHYRSNPDGNFSNNWSTKGNYNPYTGAAGTVVTPPPGNSYGIASGTVAPEMTSEGSHAFASEETVPNRFVPEQTISKARPGLLGKRHASAQLLLSQVDVKVHDSSFSATGDETGLGWFAELNAPIFHTENEQPFGLGLDAFGTLLGMGLWGDGTRSDGTAFTTESDIFGGDLGVNLYFEAADWVRPFVQLGVGFGRTDGAVYDDTGTTVFPTETDASLLFGIGAEFDIGQSVAFRTSVIPFLEGNDGFSFVNELYVNPQDRWFLRLTLVATSFDWHDGVTVTSGSHVTGGIGMGFIW